MDKITYNLDDYGLILPRKVSLLVDIPLERRIDVVSITKKLCLDVGLHLSYTYPNRSYRKFLLEYPWLKEKDVYWDWDRQINIFMKMGFELKRVDSHHGVHFFPKCWKPLMILMKKYGIKYVRNPPRKLCYFNKSIKIWLSRNKSWLFYKINKMPEGIKPLPYKETVCHIKP